MPGKLSFLFAFIISTFCVVIFITCAREYSYEGGNLNTATYTLVGAPGACSGATIMGKYNAGNALGATNIVELEAHVDKAGSYSLSTNSADGIQFFGSGIFPDTGMQTIILKGNGTPATDGNFIFTTPVASACSFTVTVNKASANTADFTLVGSPNSCSNPFINGNYIRGEKLTAANTVVVQVNVTSPGPYTLKTDTQNGISFSKSGTFSNTGVQNVTLVGSGTPGDPQNLLFTLTGAPADCSFQLAVINPEPLATYVLESGMNYCIFTPSGSYVSNTPLNSSNTIKVHVFVTVLGNFTIATSTVDGMKFSYTGTFTILGGQDVILAGTGTPVSPGIITLTPRIVGPHPIGGEVCDLTLTVL
jgi:hypothetical protein